MYSISLQLANTSHYSALFLEVDLLVHNSSAESDLQNLSGSTTFSASEKVRQQDDRMLPVWWNDNYIILFPGQTRVLTAEVSTIAIDQESQVRVHIAGWNVHEQEIYV